MLHRTLLCALLLLLASAALMAGCDSAPQRQSPPQYSGAPPQNTNATAASANTAAAPTATPSPRDTTAASPTMSAPSTQSATPTSTPGGDSVDAYLNSLPRGEVAFNTPEKMRLEQSVNVEVKLGKANLAGQLEKLIKEEGKVESHPIKVGNVMEAQLAGAGFEIIPITPAEQPLSDSMPTEWEWQVKAKQEGTQRLHLTLTVVVLVEGKERRRKIDTFKKDILVEVTSGSRIAGFVYDNVGWIVTGLLFPLFGGLGWRMRQLLRRRRGDGQPPAAPPAT
ncbi:MAG: hypothetical protein QOG71_3776 [Pyrinomonadaceae bacterium]|nr:hypothetical protein [Pyrinomonadaceae bacterium]